MSFQVLPLCGNACVVHPQREATLRSIYLCGAALHPREAPQCHRLRWSFSRTSSATSPSSRGERRRTSWSVSGRDGDVGGGSAPLRGMSSESGCRMQLVYVHRPWRLLVSVVCQLRLTANVIKLFSPSPAASSGPQIWWLHLPHRAGQ